MSLADLAPPELALYTLVAQQPPATIPDVITRMQDIDSLLLPNDGLKWFNRLYLMVTQQVDLNPPGGAWQNPLWLDRLDVVFAQLYFKAVANSLLGQPIPASWNALFEARTRIGIDRVQFALAGMNAHINHDLALALVATNAELSLHPGPGSPEYNDYQAVNGLLDTTTPAALTMLATDTLGVLAQDTGKIGRMLAFWNIIRARNLAWNFATHLRLLGETPFRSAALDAQDGITGALGRALLVLV